MKPSKHYRGRKGAKSSKKSSKKKPLRKSSKRPGTIRSTKAHVSSKPSKTVTKSPSRKRSKVGSTKRLTKAQKSLLITIRKRAKAAKLGWENRRAKEKARLNKRIQRRLKKDAHKRKGFVRTKVDSQHGALVEIDRALNEFGAVIPIPWNVSTFQNRDGSVDGSVTVRGLDDVEKWNQFFFTLSEFDRWPLGFWFSIQWGFDAPEEDFDEMEKRYERYKGGWATSSNWRESDTAAAMLTAFSTVVTKRLEGRGYQLTRLIFRLHWNEHNLKPEWR